MPIIDFPTALTLGGIIISIYNREIRTFLGLDSKSTVVHPPGVLIRSGKPRFLTPPVYAVIALGSAILLLSGKAMGRTTVDCASMCRTVVDTAFTGKIGTKQIAMTFTESAGTIMGEYYYLWVGEDHTLRIEGELQQGHLRVREYDEDGNITGRFSGTLTQPGVYEGEWIGSNGKRFAFSLHSKR
jgi:hypothetical protein